MLVTGLEEKFVVGTRESQAKSRKLPRKRKGNNRKQFRQEKKASIGSVLVGFVWVMDRGKGMTSVTGARVKREAKGKTSWAENAEPGTVTLKKKKKRYRRNMRSQRSTSPPLRTGRTCNILGASTFASWVLGPRSATTHHPPGQKKPRGALLPHGPRGVQEISTNTGSLSRRCYYECVHKRWGGT